MTRALREAPLHDAMDRSEKVNAVALQKAVLLLDNGGTLDYNNSEEQTTHTVSSSNGKACMWQKPRSCRHFRGVAADFLSCCAFAFLEVSRTMIVTVHFLM